MANQEIEQLLADSGTPCISVIVPTHRISPDRAKDEETVKNAVNLAKYLLKNNYTKPKFDVTALIEKTEDMVKNIDYVHTLDGIGIFVSPRVSKLIKFPFPVVEKVKIDSVFENRDLLYYLNSIIDYNLVSISQKQVQVFSGKGEELHEIRNEDFPMVYKETYEYSKPTIGTSFGNSSLKGFERDKSDIEEIRLKDFLRKADHLLENYINSKIPLVISGGKKEIADYMEVTRFEKRIIGKVVGHYNSDGGSQLAKLSWGAVQDYIKNQNQIHLSNLRELFGKEMVAVGIEDVWKAANEGKGLELFLQKDFECPAFISNDGYDLKLRKPHGKKKYTYSVDSVERLIEIVREKRGNVVFLENGEMKEFDSVALQLRYNGNQP